MMKQCKYVFLTSFVLLMFVTSIASASLITEYLKYSGESFGNSASATGFISFELPSLIGVTSVQFYQITDLSLTITGASSGNGTFTQSDFFDMSFYTHNSAFDFSVSLIEQLRDFNLTSNSSPAPYWVDRLTLGTDYGSGDYMQLTEMSPNSVPEPSTYILLGIALGAVGFARKKMGKQA